LGLLLPKRAALVGAAAADLGFDLVERGDALESLTGDRCRACSGELVEPKAFGENRG
jgi:hypothetical protein